MPAVLGRASAQDQIERIGALAERMERFLRREFLSLVREIRSRRSLDEIETLLREGKIYEAVEEARTAANSFASDVSAAYLVAGALSADLISESLGASFGFDQAGYGAANYMRNTRFRIVSEMVEDTRGIVVSSAAAGLDFGQQASAIRAGVGLTARQEAAVRNYRMLLEAGDRDALRRALRDRSFDETILAAITQEEPLGVSAIDRMVQAYRSNFFQFRADTVARNESWGSVSNALDEGYKQAIASGTLNADKLICRWFTMEDERVRHSHAKMHGQAQKWGVPFISGLGNLLMYPHDPSAPAADRINCRCRRTVTVVQGG